MIGHCFNSKFFNLNVILKFGKISQLVPVNNQLLKFMAIYQWRSQDLIWTWPKTRLFMNKKLKVLQFHGNSPIFINKNRFLSFLN